VEPQFHPIPISVLVAEKAHLRLHARLSCWILNLDLQFTIYMCAQRRDEPKWGISKEYGVETDGKSYEKRLKISKLSIDCDLDNCRFGSCFYEEYCG